MDAKTLARWFYFLQALIAAICLLLLVAQSHGQDASTVAIRGTVEDAVGARVESAQVVVTNVGTSIARETQTNDEGLFAVSMLPPGDYSVRVEARGMSPLVHSGLHLEVGGVVDLTFSLSLAKAREEISISGAAPMVETQASAVSAVIDEHEIEAVPLNGRRFSDLALLTPGVTQDPRGLTSSSVGDLAFGGIRGLQSSYLVDGADFNNSFFAQARGRYRAPYQFSNEVVQEFRVSSNAYGSELGRAGGAVVNVVTKSGTNYFHGTGFYYLRDSSFNARHPFVDFKPADRQQQIGGTFGGPLRKNRAFFFAGFDQHVFRVPMVVRFQDGSSVLTPKPADYETSDRQVVEMAAAGLTSMAGEQRSELLGNAGFAKLDVAISPRHYLSARANTSRYWGTNNVYFDPASPVTTYAATENGEERVSTETGTVSLTSAISARLTSHLRTQFSRDLQQSYSNADFPRVLVRDVISGFGRSAILPRQTREHRVHLAETLSLETWRQSLKFGGDGLLTWNYNYFPSLFGGQYIFDDISVDPWTFQSVTYGMWISPLRAYAHGVPRYYSQNFGVAESHPDTQEWAGFAQDNIRVTQSFALNLGFRYDVQTFRTGGLVSNTVWPASGKMPVDRNNWAPRIGFAWALGGDRQLVVRGGYGMFYTRIPAMYASQVETDNGLAQYHLLLDNRDFYDRQVFPQYPNPLATCGVGATSCTAPADVGAKLTTEISAFDTHFQTPMVQQASLGVEHEVFNRFAVSANYLYVHGEHLIRARDVNLPEPMQLSYPVFDETGEAFANAFYDINSFSNWETTSTLTCPFPPCIGDLHRPITEAGSITSFESAASSLYHGLTISARRRMTRGLYFRVAYTWARAIDDGQDALVVGRPATVENAYATKSERGASVTDQRHRFVASWIVEPRPFHRDRQLLKLLFNDWRWSGVVSAGSGRPVNARILGDANRDGNTANDRLPGVGRNSYYGPIYATTDFRLTRKIYLGEKVRLELLGEAFNTFNRANKRVDISDDGFLNPAASFVQQGVTINGRRYPASYRRIGGFMNPNNAYAPRQIQLAVRIVW